VRGIAPANLNSNGDLAPDRAGLADPAAGLSIRTPKPTAQLIESLLLLLEIGARRERHGARLPQRPGSADAVLE
jgi:hypothetical protein